MKTTITKLALVLLVGLTSLNAKANHQLSDVNIRLWNNSPFYIEFDYQRYNTNGLFSLQNVTPGYHQVKIVQHFTNPNGYGSGHVKILYAGKIHVPVASKLRIKVQPNHQLVVAATPLYNQYNGGNCGNGSYGGNGNYWNNNGYGPGGGNNGNWNNGGSYGNNGGGYGQPYFQAMNEYEFNGLLNTLNNASFDNTRLTIASQAIMNNYLTVNQVKIIMNVFSFESNRLSFAKSAYARTIDKQNYYLVNDAFSFSSSIHSLNNYINGFSG